MYGYLDRRQAGSVLAESLTALQGNPSVVVVALARGGVPVGFEVARRLGAPLEVLCVRKLGAPGRPELAIGAIAAGQRVMNEDLIESLAVSSDDIARIFEREEAERLRRERAYRGGRPPADLTRKTVVLVDDGLATGATMRVAIAAVRAQGAGAIIVAAPVGAADTVSSLLPLVDGVVCPLVPSELSSVGAWYRVFSETTDDVVESLLARSRTSAPSSD